MTSDARQDLRLDDWQDIWPELAPPPGTQATPPLNDTGWRMRRPVKTVVDVGPEATSVSMWARVMARIKACLFGRRAARRASLARALAHLSACESAAECVQGCSASVLHPPVPASRPGPGTHL